ncbi:hypothetical protein Gpo141_00010806 [Globisporangium polare]
MSKAGSGSSKRPRSAKESMRSSTRRSQSAETVQTDEQQPPNAQQVSEAEQDAMATEDERGANVAAVRREEAAVVAPPRGRGRPRKMRSAVEASVAEAPDAEAPVADIPVAEMVVAQVAIDKESEAGGGESEARTEEVVQADAGIIESIALQAEGHTADVRDADAEVTGCGVSIEVEENNGDGDADAGQKADEETKDEPDEQEEAQEETSLETADEKPSAPAKTTRKSSRLSSNASENGSTASTTASEAKPASKSRKRPLEELHQDPETQTPPQQAESTKKTKKQKLGSKISPSSSRNLFQFTCKLLESQKLEYEVRAREFEEKNAQMAAERAKWEKKIRSVKRQLSAYGHPVDAVVDETGAASTNSSSLNGSSAPDLRYRADPLDWGMAATSTALTTTTTEGFASTTTSSGSSTSLITMRDAFSSRTSFPSGVSGSGGIDSLLPASIQNLEAQIRDTLGSRAQLVQDMMKDLQEMRGLNDKITRLR